MSKRIAVIVGSIRKDSYSRQMAKTLMKIAPPELHLGIVEINHLPLYNTDHDEGTHITPTWTEFRKRMQSFDGILFVTPEYNRSVPGVLKNAIDIGSRPYGKSIWKGKPAAILSVSPGAMGGFGANHHLRQSLVFLDVPCMQQPEAYIGNVGTLFNSQGELHNETMKEFLRAFMNSFAGWMDTAESSHAA